MNLSGEIFFFVLLMGVAAIGAGWVLSMGLVPERHRPERIRSLLSWSAKGLGLPLILWALMNLGLSWRLQPFMPQVQAAQNAGSGWLPVYLQVVASGLFVVGSYWAAVTLSWGVLEAAKRAEGEARAQFKSLCLTCLVGMALPAAAMLFLGGWSLLGLAVVALLAPIAGYGPGLLHAAPEAPMYARAVARMKFGKYSEAEWEIIRELEKCEDDFDGWMMLAELYANQFHDLPQAEQTILEICTQPRTNPAQFSIALHRLADWQLRGAGDPAAARRSLQRIVDQLPGTHLARMAQLRINQLPPTVGGLRQQQRVERIPMPALGDSIDQEPAPPLTEPERKAAAEEANVCVELLNYDPKNIHAREKLARLFTERLDQPDLGIEQITLLLEVPDQPEVRRAEWLGLLAAWHIRYRQDTQTGRSLLEQLIREHPNVPQTFAARRRLQLLDAEARSQQQTAG